MHFVKIQFTWRPSFYLIKVANLFGTSAFTLMFQRSRVAMNILVKDTVMQESPVRQYIAMFTKIKINVLALQSALIFDKYICV